ncbi:hypothetical protein MCNF_17680 [Mycolicibacterium confluentis]|uniref:Uncharacterized protein n=1 Tax=Mycolicibacterium confluentis TaxID=28047 RepID=A0A7I7XVW2_9MYCO|nr:hypothetical protein MCNF_17680 [Mycolicibacterium confluentis]
MQLGVLGPLRFRQFGLPVAIPFAKPRSILTMPGLYGGAVVPGDTLIDPLWGRVCSAHRCQAAPDPRLAPATRTRRRGFVLTHGTGWTLTDAEIDADCRPGDLRRPGFVRNCMLLAEICCNSAQMRAA